MTTIRELGSRYDTFIFDCDGVLWQAENQIGQAFEAIKWLESQGKHVFFITNTAGKTPADCAAKMRRMGWAEPKLSHIYTMASVMPKYVKSKYSNVKKAFVIGMSSMREQVEAHGIKVVGADQHIIDPREIMTEAKYDNYELDPMIDAVIFGLDSELTHQKICLASLYIQERGVPLIVANGDKLALINGLYMPGSGSVLQAILIATGLKEGSQAGSTSLDEPGTFDIIGKPNPFSFNLIKQEHGLASDLSRTIMIGDNPTTDILFGKNAKIDQCLVLSGVVRGLDDFKQRWLPSNAAFKPTWIMQMVGDLDA